MLERYVEPVMMALRTLGCPPDTTDQNPAVPTRRTRHFNESVNDLIDAGLLKPGTRLHPLRRNLDGPATVLPDSSLKVDDEVYGWSPRPPRPSAANTSEPGWEFWGAPSGDGSLVSLYELANDSGAAGGTDAPAPRHRREPNPGVRTQQSAPRPGRRRRAG